VANSEHYHPLFSPANGHVSHQKLAEQAIYAYYQRTNQRPNVLLCSPQNYRNLLEEAGHTMELTPDGWIFRGCLLKMWVRTESFQPEYDPDQKGDQ